MDDIISNIEDACEEGNFETFQRLMKTPGLSKDDLSYSIDRAYYHTKTNLMQPGHAQIVDFLRQEGVLVPTYTTRCQIDECGKLTDVYCDLCGYLMCEKHTGACDHLNTCQDCSDENKAAKPLHEGWKSLIDALRPKV